MSPANPAEVGRAWCRARNPPRQGEVEALEQGTGRISISCIFRLCLFSTDHSAVCCTATFIFSYERKSFCVKTIIHGWWYMFGDVVL